MGVYTYKFENVLSQSKQIWVSKANGHVRRTCILPRANFNYRASPLHSSMTVKTSVFKSIKLQWFWNHHHDIRYANVPFPLRKQLLWPVAHLPTARKSPLWKYKMMRPSVCRALCSAKPRRSAGDKIWPLSSDTPCLHGIFAHQCILWSNEEMSLHGFSWSEQTARCDKGEPSVVARLGQRRRRWPSLATKLGEVRSPIRECLLPLTTADQHSGGVP